MTARNHGIYISILSLIVGAVFIYLFFSGLDYYRTSIENRFFHPAYNIYKPSGSMGHGLGIIGSLFMLIGIGSYMLRKRSRKLQRLGYLKHWLEFHIFLCTLGPIMVLYHTSFKFGGVVSISFWSMVAVFLSGIIGRFIYIQIPRSIEGRELSLSEITGLKTDLQEMLAKADSIDTKDAEYILSSARSGISVHSSNAIVRYFSNRKLDRKTLNSIKKILKRSNLKGSEYAKIMALIRKELSLNQRIRSLDTMKNLFKYWHVAHLPFALVMIAIMVIHVVITITLGYKWIF